MRRATAGEQAAFRDLVVRFQDMAVGYAFSLLGDYHLAEDAAQEAFLAAFRELPELRRPEAFVAWLRTVVFKQCDRIRRRRRETELLTVDDDRLVADGLAPHDALGREETARLVGRAIASLPQGSREVVSLYYIGERSGRQVATFLDLPLTTVKKRLHDAKPKLKTRMLRMTKDYLMSQRPSRDTAFADRVVRLASPKPSTDGPAIYNLFEAEDHPSRLEWRAGRLSDSHADWGMSRVAIERIGNDERLLAMLGVFDLSMRIGEAEVRAAGINGDVLHAEVAGQRDEILLNMAADSLGAMADAGYDLAVTFDDDALWRRQGFALAWQALAWRVAVADLPTAAAPADLERIKAGHRDDLAAVYNATHRGLTGTVQRPTYRRNKHPGLFTTVCWSVDGRVAGYVSIDPEPDNDRIWVDEVAGEADTCLAVLRSAAQAEGCSELFFDRFHCQSPVGVRLATMESCRVSTGSRLGKERWYLVKIVNLKSTMSKLAPSLRNRLRASEMADWRGTLAIKVRDGDADQAVTLVVHDDGLDVRDDARGPNVVSGDQSIAKLLLGSSDAEETVAENGIDVEGEARRLLRVLFPLQHPQMENQAL